MPEENVSGYIAIDKADCGLSTTLMEKGECHVPRHLFVGHASPTITRFHVMLLLEPPLVDEIIRMVIRRPDLRHIWYSANENHVQHQGRERYLDKCIEQVPPSDVVLEAFVDVKDILYAVAFLVQKPFLEAG